MGLFSRVFDTIKAVAAEDDPALEQDVAALLPQQAEPLRVTVADGCVQLDGRVQYVSQAERLADAVKHIPGVVAVDFRVGVDVDDLHVASMGV